MPRAVAVALILLTLSPTGFPRLLPPLEPAHTDAPKRAAALRAQEPPAPPAEPASPAEHLRTLERADSLYEAGRFARAAPLYAVVARSDPSNGQARFRWGRGLFEQGRLEEALERVEGSVADGWFDEAEVSLEVARAMARAGRLEAAHSFARRAVEAGLEDRPALKGEAFSALHDVPEFRRLAGLPPRGAADRVERWRHDLDFLLEEARRLHASPERVAHSPEWEQQLEALKGEAGELSDAEILVGIQRLLAALGDGHTVFYPSTAADFGFRAIPLQLYFFSDGLFVVDGAEAHRDLVGRRVVAIGGQSTDDALDELRPLVSRDNPMGLRWTGPLYLRVPPYLRAMGHPVAEDRVTLTLEDAGGGRREVTVPVSDEFDFPKLGPPPGLGEEGVPRWLRRVDDRFWHEELPGHDAVYAQINQIRDAEDRTLEAFADDVRRTLVAGGHRHLILDLRHNNGGNNFLIWPVVRTVMHHEAADPTHRTWVITGRNTFSAAQNLVNFLERETDAVFVGERSSSKPNFAGESTTVELPYAEVRMSISSRYWQDSYPGDDRPWIPVAMPVELSSEAYFGGRDPVMEALLGVLDE